MNPDDLCNQELVNEVFIPIKKKFPDLKEDIEEIEFLFKNCWYNFNRMKEIIIKYDGSIKATSKVKKSVLSSSKERFELIPENIFKIRFPLYEDIIVFEFHSLLNNIIRTIEFIVKFNLKNKCGVIEGKDKVPGLTEFLKEEYKDYYFHDYLSESNDLWIKKLKTELRDNVIHRKIIKEMQLHFELNLNKKDKTFEEKTSVGISEYGLGNLEFDCKENLDKLKDLIIEYFKE